MSSSQSNPKGRKGDSTTKFTTSTTSTKTTKPTRNTGPYNRNFQQNLVDGGIYPSYYEYPNGQIPAKPNNWEEINHRLAQRRASLSSSVFSEGAHERFARREAHAAKEKQVMELVKPIIDGNTHNAKCVAGGIPFGNLDDLTDGTLVPGNPDYYYGARPEQLNRQVRTELSGHIIPSTQDDLPIVPTFFLEGKGPDGSAAVAERQACYDGALGARGIHRLQAYGQDESVYENNAYTITSTYHNGQLKMFTSHPVQPNGPGSRSEYYMNQINTWGMTGNVKTFREGATAFRNARDWTKEQRDEAIMRANERADGSRPSACGLTTEVPTLNATTPGITPESRIKSLSPRRLKPPTPAKARTRSRSHLR